MSGGRLCLCIRLGSGFTTLGSLAFAVPASPANAQETFVLNVLGLDPADPSAMLQPEAACLRRLLASACALQLPDLSRSPGPPSYRYTAELLTPETMPSLEVLSAVKLAHHSGDSV